MIIFVFRHFLKFCKITMVPLYTLKLAKEFTRYFCLLYSITNLPFMFVKSIFFKGFSPSSSFVCVSVPLTITLDGKKATCVAHDCLRHISFQNCPRLNRIVSKQLVRLRQNKEPSVRLSLPIH
jgi:hypothetical protein